MRGARKPGKAVTTGNLVPARRKPTVFLGPPPPRARAIYHGIHAMTQATAPHSTADGISWDLGDLYAAPDDPRLTRDLQESRRRAEVFEQTYRGKIAAIRPDQADFLLTAIRQLEELYERMD